MGVSTTEGKVPVRLYSWGAWYWMKIFKKIYWWKYVLYQGYIYHIHMSQCLTRNKHCRAPSARWAALVTTVLPMLTTPLFVPQRGEWSTICLFLTTQPPPARLIRRAFHCLFCSWQYSTWIWIHPNPIKPIWRLQLTCKDISPHNIKTNCRWHPSPESFHCEVCAQPKTKNGTWDCKKVGLISAYLRETLLEGNMWQG